MIIACRFVEYRDEEAAHVKLLKVLFLLIHKFVYKKIRQLYSAVNKIKLTI